MESERLRLRIEALERLAAESRHAEEARREREERSRRSAEERRRHEADVLGRVTTDIEASLNLDTVVARVAEGARELCGGDVVGVALRESGSGAMVFRCSRRGGRRGPGDTRAIPASAPSTGPSPTTRPSPRSWRCRCCTATVSRGSSTSAT